MVVAKRLGSISLPSCMKKFTSSETESNQPGGSSVLDSFSSANRSGSVRSLPPGLEDNLRLACTNVLQAKNPSPPCDQVAKDDLMTSSHTQADEPPVLQQSGPQAWSPRRSVAQATEKKMESSQGFAPRSRAQSRVDELMGQPRSTQTENGFDGRRDRLN